MQADFLQTPENAPILRPLFLRIAMCVGSPHFQVAERALLLFSNEFIVELVEETDLSGGDATEGRPQRFRSIVNCGRPAKDMVVEIRDEDGGPLAHTEFLAFDMGPTVMYKVSRGIQLNADIVYQARFRKGFSHGPTGHLGVRYLFD